MISLASRGCIILSDNDHVARTKQKDYVAAKGYGLWMRYDELFGGAPIVTAEDFIKPAAFREPVEQVKQKHNGLPDLPDNQLCDPRGKIYALNKWLGGALGADEEKRIIIESIKEHVFVNLTPANVEPIYYEMAQSLAKKLES